jgi:hypothetical protein
VDTIIVDEFSADLIISERLLSACGAITATLRGPGGLYVLPMFTGVHRTLVPRQMANLLGMNERPSGNMITVVTMMTSLSVASRDTIVRNMTQKLVLPPDSLRSALGRILNDCGGWPSSRAKALPRIRLRLRRLKTLPIKWRIE